MSELKLVKCYISSPTEDGFEESGVNSDKSTLEPPSVSSKNNTGMMVSWPPFTDIKGVLDFKSSAVLSGDRLIALLAYIIKGSVSSVNVENIRYMSKLFYENEIKLYSAYRDNRSISDEKVKDLLNNRVYMQEEILKELDLQK